jgi:hypothetical protein
MLERCANTKPDTADAINEDVAVVLVQNVN